MNIGSDDEKDFENFQKSLGYNKELGESFNNKHVSLSLNLPNAQVDPFANDELDNAYKDLMKQNEQNAYNEQQQMGGSNSDNDLYSENNIYESNESYSNQRSQNYDQIGIDENNNSYESNSYDNMNDEGITSGNNDVLFDDYYTSSEDVLGIYYI